MKRTIILIALYLLTLGSFGQISYLECRARKFGDFVSGKPRDSVYLYRTFANWYEMNTSGGFRNIFTIIWRDDCHFSLVFKDGSVRPDSLKTYSKGDTLSYSALSCTDTTITFEVTNKLQKYQQTLSRVSGLDVWGLMLSRDTALRADSTFKDGFGESVPDTVRQSLSPYEQQIREASFNRQEMEQIEYVLSLIRNQDIVKIDSIASDDFKKLIPKTVLAAYNEYLKSAYGKLLSYSLYSSAMSVHFDTLFRNMSVNDVSKHVLDAGFSKTTAKVQITITLKKDSLYKIQSLNVESIENPGASFAARLTKDFWALLKAKEFKTIYDNSSRHFKAKASYEQTFNILSLIYSYGRLSFYKLADQNFRIDGAIGYVATKYALDKDNRKGMINLSYVHENGRYKLAGLNYEQR